MAKPSILLAPGSFAVPEFYDPIFEAVRAQGYDIRGLHLPSAGLRALEGRPGKPPGMYDDAAFIAHEIGTLADAGKDVVMIAHSYAGIPVSQAAKGLSKEERGKQSKPGGLVRLAYLTCLVPPLGGTAVSILAETPDEDKVDMKAGVRYALQQVRVNHKRAPLLTIRHVVCYRTTDGCGIIAPS